MSDEKEVVRGWLYKDGTGQIYEGEAYEAALEAGCTRHPDGDAAAAAEGVSMSNSREEILDYAEANDIECDVDATKGELLETIAEAEAA